jgi:ribosomal protein S18 acetylase RimI-like enzyme
MFSNHPLKKADAEIICRFPQSEEELFYMFPRSSYPLTPEKLLVVAEERKYPTVVTLENTIVGYGNFINANPGDHCSIGNLIVNPGYRKTGVATYLVKYLVEIAFSEFKAEYVRISCFNHNTAGLLLYKKLGFSPVDLEQRQSHEGKVIAVIHLHLKKSNPRMSR